VGLASLVGIDAFIGVLRRGIFEAISATTETENMLEQVQSLLLAA
jgi:hypothetical protein